MKNILNDECIDWYNSQVKTKVVKSKGFINNYCLLVLHSTSVYIDEVTKLLIFKHFIVDQIYVHKRLLGGTSG